MYAVVGTVTISDYEHAHRLLHDDVLPTSTTPVTIDATKTERLTVPSSTRTTAVQQTTHTTNCTRSKSGSAFRAAFASIRVLHRRGVRAAGSAAGPWSRTAGGLARGRGW